MTASRFNFRAWDREAGGIRNFFYLDTFGAPWGMNEEGEMVSLGDRYVVMQSTGLTDRNGREIFEGDLISYDVTDKSIPPYPVEWDHCQARWCMVSMTGRREPLFMSEHVEIVGNKFEGSPELLK